MLIMLILIITLYNVIYLGFNYFQRRIYINNTYSCQVIKNEKLIIDKVHKIQQNFKIPEINKKRIRNID